MKIINWNVGRPTKNKGLQILNKLNEMDADIVILTETNSSIALPTNYNLVSTNPLPESFDGVKYKSGENRTSIWTKFPLKKSHKTFDSFTSVCVEIVTPLGLLRIYATIIGVFGGKGQRFENDLLNQLSDFNTLLLNGNACLVGDYNVSFTGYAYPSYSARQTLNNIFQKFSLINLTGSIENCVDHIAISSSFIKNKKVVIDVWNLDKILSDHVGISATLIECI